MNRLALAELDLGAGDDVIEIGFGGGELLGWIADRTLGAVHGADISEAAVRAAGARFGGRVRLHVASVDSLPLAGSSLDKAVSVNNIYFWSDPDAALAELARILRPGGRLVLCFEPADELRKWPGHRHGFRLYEVAEVKALLEGAGFSVIREAWGSGRRPDRFCCLTAALGKAEAAR